MDKRKKHLPKFNIPEPVKDEDAYLLELYDEAIRYCRNANKSLVRKGNQFKSRLITLGSLAILTSLPTALGLTATSVTFSILVPAVSLLSIGAMVLILRSSEPFQWGAKSQQLIIYAQQIEKERDRLLVTTQPERKYQEDFILIKKFVISLKELEPLKGIRSDDPSLGNLFAKVLPGDSTTDAPPPPKKGSKG